MQVGLVKNHRCTSLLRSGCKEGVQFKSSGLRQMQPPNPEPTHPIPPHPIPATLPTCINLQRKQGSVAEGVGHHLDA